MNESVPPPARRVVLVVGPPGAGKSTVARRMASEEGLAVYESEMFPYPSHERMKAAVALLKDDPDAHAVIVRCCPMRLDQHEWEVRAGVTETVVLDVDPDVCVRRIMARGRPRWRGEAKAAREWRRRRAAGGVTAREW